MASETKARPIIFAGESVRAILDGRKTQTRRVADVWDCGRGMISPNAGYTPRSPSEHVKYCPYGGIGGRLWVRETWACITGFGDVPSSDDAIEYRADGSEAGAVITRAKAWRPSMFMPRAYSRLTLEITDIRVQRVQEINEGDARAEGVEPNWCGDLEGWSESEHGYLDYSLPEGWDGDEAVYMTPRESFRTLWDSINAKRGYGWDSNPWVWAVEFKRCEVEPDA